MRCLGNYKVVVFADQAVFSGGSFLLTILIARYLGAADFGIYAAYVLLMYLAISAISAWTIQVFQVAANQSISYVSFVFWLQVLILLVFAWPLLYLSHLLNLGFSYAILAYAFGCIMYDFSRKMLLALEKLVFALILDAATAALLLLSFVFFQYFGKKSIDDLLLCFAISYGFSSVLSVFFIKPFSIQLKTCLLYVKLHTREGKWLFLTAFSQWWAGNLFVVASGVYLGSAALGALRLAQSLFGILNVMLQTFENYILPQTALKMKNSFPAGIIYLRRMNLKLGYLFLPILLLIFIFAEPIIRLAGGEAYANYAFVMKGLSVLYLFVFLSQPFRFLFRSLQLNDHFFYAYLLSLIFALLSSHSLLSSFGLQGVIAGLIGTQTILITYWILVLQIKNKQLWKLFTSY